MRKSRKILVVVAIIGLIITLAGMSYAYIRVRKNQDSINSMSMLRCLGVDYSDETNAVSLDNVYPVSDEEGMKTPIYKFKVTNKCNTKIYAKINLETLTLNNLIDLKHVKVWLNNKNLNEAKIGILNNEKIFTRETKTLAEAEQSNNLMEISMGEYESEEFELRLWLDEATTWEEGKNTSYAGKITVSVSPNPNTSVTKGDFTMYAYIDGKISSIFPETDNYNAVVKCNSFANNDANNDIMGTINWNGKRWLMSVVSISSGETVCNVYFTKKSEGEVQAPTNWYTSSEGTLLAAIRKNYPSATTPGTTPGLNVSESGEKVLAGAADDYGTSYYFRGAIDNNYVEFANKCWRIVRITGDGSIKLVLHNDNINKVASPCVASNNDTTAAFARYSGTTYTSVFNSAMNDNAYVGFMYGEIGKTTYAETHKNSNKSAILQNLEKWYNTYISTYESKLADTIWCNDKSVYKTTSYNPWSIGTRGTKYGIGTNVNYYNSVQRLLTNSNTAGGTGPTLICPNDNLGGKLSKLTVNDTVNGNGALDKKIGLLTIDEIVFAGAVYKTANTTYYLYENASGSQWWSLTPSHYGSGGDADVWRYLNSSEYIRGEAVNEARGLRPAISLKSITTISKGTGTSSDPYVIN